MAFPMTQLEDLSPRLGQSSSAGIGLCSTHRSSNVDCLDDLFGEGEGAPEGSYCSLPAASLSVDQALIVVIVGVYVDDDDGDFELGLVHPDRHDDDNVAAAVGKGFALAQPAAKAAAIASVLATGPALALNQDEDDYNLSTHRSQYSEANNFYGQNMPAVMSPHKRDNYSKMSLGSAFSGLDGGIGYARDSTISGPDDSRHRAELIVRNSVESFFDPIIDSHRSDPHDDYSSRRSLSPHQVVPRMPRLTSSDDLTADDNVPFFNVVSIPHDFSFGRRHLQRSKSESQVISSRLAPPPVTIHYSQPTSSSRNPKFETPQPDKQRFERLTPDLDWGTSRTCDRAELRRLLGMMLLPTENIDDWMPAADLAEPAVSSSEKVK